MHAAKPRVAVVTGGSGGIGHYICLEMARSGWDICLGYHRHEDQAHEIVDHAVHGGQALIDRVASSIPLGRASTPEEVAEVVDFLCGPKPSYVHGALNDIGGGR